MKGRLPNGLPYAQEGEVRVVLFVGGAGGGSVQVKAKHDADWRIARPGEVGYGTVIELTRLATPFVAQATAEKESAEDRIAEDIAFFGDMER